MSALSKVALALTVSVAACGERSPVAPSSASTFGAMGTRLSSPTDLRAQSLGSSEDVVISWTYHSPAYSTGVSGFLVERALDAAGPWSIHRFTQGTTASDALSGDQHYCYRVIAVSSSPELNSAPSESVCIAGSAGV